ncbi:MAG: DUF763 domain-containing protein [Candidatus Brockarchaeota archaeon]|nr:DUF763 domain-containing protein [Candidatus Brockarchaeota archaeon]
MKRAGSFELSLHGGRAPAWLTERMKRLASAIVEMILDEYGEDKFLANLSDPLWFQAFSCVLAYDWDSSGTTTVTCGVLKDVLNGSRLGLRCVGGKGSASRKAPWELAKAAEELGLGEQVLEKLRYSSKMCAKVDNAAIQAGYQLYHHSMFVTSAGKWAVVQQGMNPSSKTARRYHWLSEGLASFVEEPHRGIVGQMAHERVLDMTARESDESRKVCADLASEHPDRVRRHSGSIRQLGQESLGRWLESANRGPNPSTYALVDESRINWKALEKAYEIKPSNYEELLAIRGFGPSTARALALIAEVVYGARTSWKDPVKFSFAFGGKDGIPFPVKRKVMDRSISILQEAVQEARIGETEKVRAVKRLMEFTRRLTPP